MVEKKQNKARWVKRLESTVFTVGLGVSLGMVASLVETSPYIGIPAFGFTALAFFTLFEQNRRRTWEKNAERHFTSFDQTVEMNSIREKLLKHERQIASLHTLVHENRMKIKAAQHKRASKNTHLKPSVSFKKFAGMPYVPPRVAANDEPPSYYNSLSDTVIRELVNVAVRNDGMEVFMQPIMRLPEQTVRGYEVFSRVRSRPGHYIPATRYIDLAREDKTIDMIEPMLLMRCLNDIKERAGSGQYTPKTTYFINITGQTLKNKLFMGRLLEFLKTNRKLASCLVFEIPQDEFTNASEGIKAVLKGLGKLGCAFSLDHVRVFRFDPAELQSFRVHFVKLDASNLQLIVDNTKLEQRFLTTKRALERHGIGVIAEKVENQAMLQILRGFDLHYGQGYALGKPQIFVSDAHQERYMKKSA